MNTYKTQIMNRLRALGLILTMLITSICQFDSWAISPSPELIISKQDTRQGTESSKSQETTYRLTVVVNPTCAGFANVDVCDLNVGEEVNVYTSGQKGFIFNNWTIDDKEVSTLEEFNYVMPDHDVTLVANYVYAPASPGNPSPEDQKVKHPIVIRSNPECASSFQPSGSFSMEENESRQIYAYPRTGWKLVDWTINGEKSPETGSSLLIQMGQKALDVVANFIYDPVSPSNPSSNYYNPESGEIIIDDFIPGNFYDAFRNLVGENLNKPYSLIVKGELSESDLSSLQFLSNAVTIDITRSIGIKEIPSDAFYSLDASSILFPSTIETMGDDLFSGCENLTSLTFYSPLPPICTASTFEKLRDKSELIVYVPASSIELYTNSEYWQDFTILPIASDVSTLQVFLPQDAADGQYKHCSLEIVNARSGVRQKYIISDRLLYTFNGLQKDEKYNIYMFSQAGLEIGRIEDVVIPDQDIEVTFDNLKSLNTVFAQVLSADGSDVTSQVTVEWLKPLPDGTTTYLHKAVSIGEIPDGQQLICRVSLDNKLGVVYSNPEDIEFTVGSDNNICLINLIPFRSIELLGSVVDGDGAALAGASVVATQALNGKYYKTYIAKTDRKGQWNLEVFDAKNTRLTYAANECITVIDTIVTFDSDVNTFDLGITKMKEIVGARVTYGFNYHGAGSEDWQAYYSDYQNVSISVFNITQNRAHKEFSLQYPILAILDEHINVGDELILTAMSKKGAFNPIVETVTIGDDLCAEVTFDIIDKGSIAASFELTDNPSVIAMLYSGKGELLNKITYSDAKATFTELEDGDYTLVSMGQSDMMNSILHLSSFAEIGLTEGKDYVKNAVQVESGKLTEVKITEIPVLDESLFYYTNSSTCFSSNKSSITTGNYLTLRSAIDFNSIYEDKISNVTLVVDLPEACDFVEQSVIHDNVLLPYIIDNKRLTVPLGNNFQGPTRFCVIPTTGGTFNATASIVFDYNGKTLTQPIGSVVSEIKDIEISVPNIIASTEFIVTGVALPKSEVDIYNNGTIIGNCQANAKGMWSANCNISDPIKLATLDVFAHITTPAHNELITESREVCYDPEAPLPATVTMIFWNGYYDKQYEVEWDLIEGTCNSNKYDFSSTTNFTFIVKFTNNDPEKIRNIVLNIFTSSGDVKKLVPIFSEEQKCWVAVESFSSSSLPNNVSVDYELNSASRYDSEFLSDNLNPSIAIANEFEENKEWLDSTIESLNITEDEGEENVIIEDILSRYDISVVADDKVRTEDSISMKIAQMVEDPDYLNNLLSSSPWGENLNDYSDGISVHTCAGLSIEYLNEQGFYSFEKSDGNFSYYFCDESTWQFVDFQSDIYLIINVQSKSPLAKMLRSGESDIAEGWIEKIEQLSRTIRDLVEGIYGFLNSCNENLDAAYAIARSELADLYADKRWLDKNSNNAWLKGEIKFKISAKTKVLEGIEATSKWLNNTFKQYMSGGGKWGKIAGKAFSFGALIIDGIDAVKEVNALIALRDELSPSCPAAEVAVKKLKDSSNRWAIGAGIYYFGKLSCDIAEIGGVTAGIAALVPSGGTSTSAILASIAVMAANIAADYAYSKLVGGFKNRTIRAYEKTKKLCKEEDPNPEDFPDDEDPPTNDNGDTNPNHYPDPKHPHTDQIDPILDPSGYVYEAVPSNRIEGVQATIYYKETKEDMYGDPYEEVVLWNAEEYAQKNPLFTDENGMYQWDVPQGLWQVKFEKDGYQTAYSEWLPVPPPQLDVNIGMVQNKQPEVIDARAYEEGIEVQFDKFMDLSTLTTSNIFVTANGEKLNGEIRFIDSSLADEYASEDDADALRYASRVRFVPEEKLGSSTGEIRLTVSRNVLSYAGIPMPETYSQVLDVEKEVQAIVAEDVKVLYGGEKEVTVYALPYEAAVGRTLHISVSSDLIASVDLNEVVLDDEGKAKVRVKGEIPGIAQLSFTIDDVTTRGACTIDVVREILSAEAPTSSRVTGTSVYRGTEIELSTESKNATIYFTTDGSCPCDETGTRQKYTQPIVINDNMRILAITSVETGGGETSEVVEFNYTLKRSDMDFQMPEGWTWISHSFENSISPSSLTTDEGVERILGQTGEVIRDPEVGMIGTLTALTASESYKVEASSPTTRQRLSDVAWNPSTPIAVNSGWNWLGYPLSQTMSVNEAFAPTEAETLDIIVGQEGFAQFDGENWIGTLETMNPGKGYMYQSQSGNNIIYNTSLVSSASVRRTQRIARKSPLVLDIHKYGVIMPVVATLSDSEGSHLDNEDYQVAAFCGSECRGIGKVVNGLVMMNVYGNLKDVITFVVTDVEGDMTFGNDGKLDFSEVVVGSLFDPYTITIDSKSGVEEVKYEGNIQVSIEGDMLWITGIAAEDIDLVEIYDLNGHKLIRETRISESGIKISTLTDGVYVVIVRGNGEYSYHKIAVR